MAEKRLFIGVKIHATEQRDLQAVQKRLKEIADKSRFDIRWTPLDNWHITLKFLGHVDVSKIAEIKEAMSELGARHPAFKVRASDVNGFPEPRHARVVYAGVSRTQKLLDLQSELDIIATDLGYKSEEREYKPHLTLGRLRSASSVTDLVSPFVRKKFADLKISEITLFESVQHGACSVYVPIHTVSLKAPEFAGELSPPALLEIYA